MSKFRLVTRSDFDGLVGAILLRELDLIGEVAFAHPKDVQDGRVEIGAGDITANLPYVPGAHLAFDHHYSEMLRNVGTEDSHYINIPNAPSAARVIFDYYGGRDRFPSRYEEMMAAVDRADSAQFTKEQVLEPAGWDLFAFVLDPRTGLERVEGLRQSETELISALVAFCRDHDIEEVLRHPDVKERVDVFLEQRPLAETQIKESAVEHEPLVVIDLRDRDPIYCANRFLVYAIFPNCNISIHVIADAAKETVELAIGKSIFKRTSRVDIDSLTLAYGGGGHESVGTCRVPANDADRVLGELIEKIRQMG